MSFGETFGSSAVMEEPINEGNFREMISDLEEGMIVSLRTNQDGGANYDVKRNGDGTYDVEKDGIAIAMSIGREEIRIDNNRLTVQNENCGEIIS